MKTEAKCLMSVTTVDAKPTFEKLEEKFCLDSSTTLFLAWGPPSHTPRSHLLAKQLGIPLMRVHVLKHRWYLAPLRYPLQAIQTFIVLARRQPQVVFVQNPPIFAALMAYLHCCLFGGQFIIDSHTDALLASIWEWSLPLHRFLSRRATATIVTNEFLSEMVSGWGARSLIIRDVPSNFPVGRSAHLEHDFNVVMVNTYSPDEPLDSVLEAAAALPEVGFYITGDPARAHKPLPTDLPPNVHLTGYLSEEDYYGLLRSAQVVMCLTTVDHTMQRGACEAVWLEKPIITSDWPLLQEFFHKGTIHVDNTAEGIRQAALHMQSEHSRLAAEIKELQAERRKLWQQWVVELQTVIKGDQTNAS